MSKVHYVENGNSPCEMPSCFITGYHGTDRLDKVTCKKCLRLLAGKFIKQTPTDWSLSEAAYTAAFPRNQR